MNEGQPMADLDMQFSSPDPISEPKAYQDYLIGLVGDDDPAEAQAAAPARIRALLADAGDDAATRPSAGRVGCPRMPRSHRRCRDRGGGPLPLDPGA